MRDQCRWFGGMVGNHVADIVEKYGESGAVPKALTDYIKAREGYDYNQHGQAGNTHADFVPDDIVDRFCVLGTADDHIEKLKALKELGCDQFAGYLQHDNKEETLRVYGETVMPALREHVSAKRAAARVRRRRHADRMSPELAPQCCGVCSAWSRSW